MKPLVSIITPIYNAQDYLDECIRSVLNQSYKNWELILIDDCSTDNSLVIVDGYLHDIRIKLIQNEVNLGPAETRNRGLKLCLGEYITFLDSDDFFSEYKLERQVNFMRDKRLLMSHGNYYFCSLSGEIIKEVITDKKISYHDLLKGNQFKIMTVMLSRKAIIHHKFKNIKHEDYSFFLEVLKDVPFSFNYFDSSSFCRIGKVSVSSNKFKSAIWTWNIYLKDQKLGLWKSMYYFINYIKNGFIKYK